MSKALKVGDIVCLTKRVSIKHFRAAEMATTGRIVKIDPNYTEGNHLRPYFVKFSDRPGEWAYAASELRKIKPVPAIIITDDSGYEWAWNGERLLCVGDYTPGGGYPASTVKDVIEILVDGGYISQDVVEEWAFKAIGVLED
jgi:hypothetical protein